MTDPELPLDLAALERQLAARPLAEPPADLGPRLLAATRAALRCQPTAAPPFGLGAWAARAAAVLVVINLSMSVAANTEWSFGRPAGSKEAPATVAWLRAAAPDLPEVELRRQTLLVRAGSQLTPTVNLTPNRERDRWDER